LIGLDVFPLDPEYVSLQLSPFVPVTVQLCTLPTFQ
jgi:hypothetical protein